MPASAPTAQWTLSNEKHLVSYLHEHDSLETGNFKMATFQAAATVLKVAHTTGGPKTTKTCQTSGLLYVPCILLLVIFSQLL